MVSIYFRVNDIVSFVCFFFVFYFVCKLMKIIFEWCFCFVWFFSVFNFIFFIFFVIVSFSWMKVIRIIFVLVMNVSYMVFREDFDTLCIIIRIGILL